MNKPLPNLCARFLAIAFVLFLTIDSMAGPGIGNAIKSPHNKSSSLDKKESLKDAQNARSPQPLPLLTSNTLLYWPMTVDNSDDAGSRAAGVGNSTTVHHKLYNSNNSNNNSTGAVPPYGTDHGQALSASSNGDGTWSTTAGGPGGTLRRNIYEQFTITAQSNYSLNVDSIVFKSSFYATASSIRVAIVYSKTGFTTNDSTLVTSGVSDGVALAGAVSGNFPTSFPLTQENGPTTKNYRFPLSGSTGVAIDAGKTLTIRLYFCCSSSTAGKYVKLKDVYIKGAATLSATSTVTTTGSLNNFTQTIGTASAAQTYTVSGTNLTNNIVITPPVNYEVSSDGGTTWFTNASPLTLAQSGGTVAATTISVRLNAVSAGSYSGNIANASIGATTSNQAVNGTTASTTIVPNVTVAKDGSGNYLTVQAAIDAAPTGRTSPYIIFIKNGKYKEKITVPSNKPFLQFRGESVANTILTFDDYSGKANPAGGTFGTGTSASVTINAMDFSAFNVTFENTTGDSPQALAINVNADRAVFKNCRFLGGQDTVLANGATNGNGNRQYFRNCYIDGVVDFIFGNAVAVFDSCVIHPKTRVDGNSSYITAANTPNGQTYGYVFRNCTIATNAGVTKYVLGRPWQNSTGSSPLSFPKVVFINTTIGYNMVSPEGWSIWDAGTDTNLIFDAEYKSKKFNGTLIDVSKRVPWSFQLTDPQAANYTNATLFGTWDPCSVSADMCLSAAAPIAVSNFKGKKGTTTTAISWNISWAKSNIKYELFRSSDNATFGKINEQTSVNDTTIVFNYSDPIPAPGTSYYYYLKASKSGFDSHTTETIQISSVPTITVTGSLSSFLQGIGLPSAKQGFSVSAVNLTEGVNITVPANFEISTNGGTTWSGSSTPITLTQSGGNVASITIAVRLNATTAGTYSGNVALKSAGATTVNVAVTGTVQTDPLPISVTLLYWPMSADNKDAADSRSPGVAASTPTLNKLFVSNGTTVPSVPSYSTAHGQAFGPTSNGDGSWTPAPGGTLSRQYYEQYTITAQPNYSVRVDSIVFNSSFYNTSSNTKLAVVFSKTGFTTADSTNVSGGSSTGVSLDAAANGGFVTPVLLINETAGTTKNYRFALAGSTGVTIEAGQTITIRLYFACGSGSAGRYAKVKDVYVKGLAKLPPSVNVTGTLATFTQAVGSPSSTETYTASGSNLTSGIVITPPVNFEVSADGGTTWFTNTSPLTLAPVSGSVLATTIAVRLNASTTGSYSGNIGHTTTGVSVINVPVEGTTSPVTGISEVNEHAFYVSPNPAQDVLVVHHPEQSNTTISLYTTTGVEIGSYPSSETSETVIDVKSMTGGLYFVRCAWKNGSVVVRFIKR